MNDKVCELPTKKKEAGTFPNYKKSILKQDDCGEKLNPFNFLPFEQRWVDQHLLIISLECVP